MISEFTNNTLFGEFPILRFFNDKISTKIGFFFDISLSLAPDMANKDNKMMRRRLANAYLSSVISISLVLLLVGVASMLLVNAKGVSDYFKENMQVSVLMKDSVPDQKAMSYAESLLEERYIKTATFISKEQGQMDPAGGKQGEGTLFVNGPGGEQGHDLLIKII